MTPVASDAAGEHALASLHFSTLSSDSQLHVGTAFGGIQTMTIVFKEDTLVQSSEWGNQRS